MGASEPPEVAAGSRVTALRRRKGPDADPVTWERPRHSDRPPTPGGACEPASVRTRGSRRRCTGHRTGTAPGRLGDFGALTRSSPPWPGMADGSSGVQDRAVGLVGALTLGSVTGSPAHPWAQKPDLNSCFLPRSTVFNKRKVVICFLRIVRDQPRVRRLACALSLPRARPRPQASGRESRGAHHLHVEETPTRAWAHGAVIFRGVITGSVVQGGPTASWRPGTAPSGLHGTQSTAGARLGRDVRSHLPGPGTEQAPARALGAGRPGPPPAGGSAPSGGFSAP